MCKNSIDKYIRALLVWELDKHRLPKRMGPYILKVYILYMFILCIGEEDKIIWDPFFLPLFLVSTIFYHSFPNSSTLFSSHYLCPHFFSVLFFIFFPFLGFWLLDFFGSQPGCPNIQNLQPWPGGPTPEDSPPRCNSKLFALMQYTTFARLIWQLMVLIC